MFDKRSILGSDVLDHLGLAAATIDKLGIVNRIDKLSAQSGRETQQPSMKWIYRLFHGVHILKVNSLPFVLVVDDME